MVSRWLAVCAGLLACGCVPTERPEMALAAVEGQSAAVAGSVTLVADDGEEEAARADAAKADAAGAGKTEASPARAAQAVAQALAAPSADPLARKALASSLAAYARREAGLPADPAPARKGVPAAPRIYAFAPVQFELAGPAGAAPGFGRDAAPAAAPGIAAAAPQAGLGAQRWRAAYDGVETACFPDALRRALDQIADHFKSEVLVTSGARQRGRRGSMHRSCKAADIRVAGVSPGALAAYARTVPGVNGVGTYRWVSVTHVDVRDEKFAWRW